MKRPISISAPVGALALLVALFIFAPAASADKVISEAGVGLGQTNDPQGVAVDSVAKRLYVADTRNDRIEVFDADTGTFLQAFGGSGSGKGQFNHPTGVAVDPFTHDVYVVDFGNLRVQKFGEKGEFKLAFGGGVNQTTSGDICTGESGNVCRAGVEGFGEGEFSSNSGFGQSGIFAGIGPGGTVYVVDSRRPEGPSKYRYRLQRFAPSGTVIAPQHVLLEDSRANELAVDSTGAFYVSSEGVGSAIRKYNAAGSEELGEIPAGDVTALAIGAADHLFVASADEGVGINRNIAEYDPAGIQLRRFAYGGYFTGLAFYHSGNGDIFTSEGGDATDASRILHLNFPSPGPIILPQPCEAAPLGNTKATLNAKVNPEGKPTTYHFQYITEGDFLANGNSFSGAHPATATSESESIGSDFKLHIASAQADVVPSTEYRCRIVVVNADAPAGITGEAGAFTSLDPLEIGSTWVTAADIEAVTLNAAVNPLGIPTTGYFEYVEEATYLEDVAKLGLEHGFDHAAKAPDIGAGEEPIDFGSGESFKAGTAEVSGLKAGTAYRYRIIATDSYFPTGFLGSTKTFRTFIPGSGSLPDSRAYELVSPGQKNSAEVAVPEVSSGLVEDLFTRTQAAAPSGEAVTYTSWTAFGEPEGAPASSQYLSRRSPSGWGTENISPFGFQRNALNPPYHGFSPDLAFAGVVVSEPALAEDCQEGFENLYLRNNATGALRCLTTEVPIIDPAEKKPFCLGYAGASADGSRAFFSANAKLTPDAPDGEGFNLYEWSSDEGTLSLLSVLPGEIPATPSLDMGFGAKGGGCSTGERRPAISADGSRVFWTYVAKAGTTKLLARVNGAETVQLDLKEGGAGASGGGIFQAASDDGSAALFTAATKLKAGSGIGDLYRYDLDAPEGERLRDLTPDSLTPGAEAADVQGVVGISDDGAYAYFVAKGVLSGEEENDVGQRAKAGQPNLYLWREGGANVRFIANLSSVDVRDWDPAPRNQTARVSADGRHLAFLSIATESLANYDNVIATGPSCQPDVENKLLGDSHCPEAFIYDAESEELDCASCNPTGSRPLGPSLLLGASNPSEGPRYLSDDGSRLFFESLDALLSDDENQKRDVYEFERTGKGTCALESPSFDATTGGCLFLVSTAQSKDHSYLLDASPDGHDVFLSTRQALVGWDTNENYDVYDVRVGGGFPEPVTQVPCGGEACKPPSAAVPSFAGAATPYFQGPLNAKPKKAKKPRRHKRNAHAHHKRRAHHNGRAGR
jgi:sugar lactone lactonase YvrE